ncbi:MAG TPA: glycosyltransferase family 4 protein [Cytophagaceae bacterium]|jgi:glycosyltransferase involved in cell wall biosynthesis
MNLEKTSKKHIICNHLGARCHYDFAKAFNHTADLTVITEVWIPKSSLLSKFLRILPLSLAKKFLQRYDAEINGKVRSFNLSSIIFEIRHRVNKIAGWDFIIKRNNWFESLAVDRLNTIKIPPAKDNILFSFSYTALKPFEFAKSKGWKTLLFQIDPGSVEELIVADEYRQNNLESSWEPAPDSYWEDWKRELDLSDKIIVNSEWTRKALLQIGVEEDKLITVPLMYEHSKNSENVERTYPPKFSGVRPLKVLFLGTLTLRKGLTPLLKSIELLSNEHIEFCFVGQPEVVLPHEVNGIKLNIIPSVPRSETANYYKNADVFIFPTLSDGFGLTQLEAMAWKLPVIASKYCGDVVEHDFSGLLLDEVTAESIADSLKFLINNPSKLEYYSRNTTETLKKFSREKFEEALGNIFKS